MRVIINELYKFFSDIRRTLYRTLFFYRPAPVIIAAISAVGVGDIRNYIYMGTTIYALFIGLIFSVYYLPARISNELNGPALMELTIVRRETFLISRVLSTYIIELMIIFFPVMSIFLTAYATSGLRSIFIGLLITLIIPLLSISAASVGFLFVSKKNGSLTVVITYVVTIMSIAFPYILYISTHSPVYLLAIILSPGFFPSITIQHILIRLGAEGISNDIRKIYASYRGLNPYYPNFLYAFLPFIIYISLIIVFRTRFKDADL